MKKIGLKHFNYLTDDFSIWQHTKGPEIDRKHGYSLDDGARALLVAIKIKDYKKAQTYLNFLEKAVGNGRIVNFYDSKRRPLNKPWSEDALGEAYWALAECIAHNFNRQQAIKIIQSITPKIIQFRESRGMSYVILGASKIDLDLTEFLIDQLDSRYQKNAKTDWNWPENELNYANAILPFAFLAAGEAINRRDLTKHGLEMLNFLNKELKENSFPITVGNKGWYKKTEPKAIFDQQPIDAAYQVLANLKAWSITNSEKYLTEAKGYFSWFWGNNLIKKSLIGLKDESCHDGLHCDGIDDDRGSESIVCYLLAQEEIWPHLKSSD